MQQVMWVVAGSGFLVTVITFLHNSLKDDGYSKQAKLISDIDKILKSPGDMQSDDLWRIFEGCFLVRVVYTFHFWVYSRFSGILKTLLGASLVNFCVGMIMLVVLSNEAKYFVYPVIAFAVLLTAVYIWFHLTEKSLNDGLFCKYLNALNDLHSKSRVTARVKKKIVYALNKYDGKPENPPCYDLKEPIMVLVDTLKKVAIQNKEMN